MDNDTRVTAESLTARWDGLTAQIAHLEDEQKEKSISIGLLRGSAELLWEEAQVMRLEGDDDTHITAAIEVLDTQASRLEREREVDLEHLSSLREEERILRFEIAWSTGAKLQD